MKPIIPMLCLLALAAGSPPLYSLSNPPIRPDATLTPGAVFPNVTVEQLAEKGYANKLNGGVRDVPESEKRAVYEEYFGAVPANAGKSFEVDHLISLELGGSNDKSNLWPEPYSGQWNAHVKDKLEDALAASVRQTLKSQGHDAATALLGQYQHEISTDWIASYQKHIGGSP